MVDVARGIRDQLGVVVSGRASCCAGLSWLDLQFAGASVSLTGSMPGLMFCVWSVYILGAAKRFLLFIGLVDIITSGGTAPL